MHNVCVYVYHLYMLKIPLQGYLESRNSDWLQREDWLREGNGRHVTSYNFSNFCLVNYLNISPIKQFLV